MARLLLALLLIAGLYAGGRAYARLPAWQRRRVAQGLLWLVALALIGLALTGRVHWLAAAIAPLALVARLLGRLLPALPLVARLLASLRSARSSTGGGTGAHGPHGSQDGPAGTGSRPRRPGAMSPEDARAVLGVSEGATRKEILEAHRRLMQKVHPDKGGTDYLASQINRARDVLLGRR